MKQRWDKFVDDTRRRLRQLNPRNRVRHRPTYVCGHIEYLSYTPVQYDNSTHISSSLSTVASLRVDHYNKKLMF